MRGNEPTVVDYETYQEMGVVTPPEGEGQSPAVLGRVGNACRGAPGAGLTRRFSNRDDALPQTVQAELRAALDGQARRQNDLLDRLSTLPQVAEALPQTSKMQSDMLKLINDRLTMHADQQRKVTQVINAVGGSGGAGAASAAKKEYAEALQSIREQIEMGNEIDRQLVESFNRFSMMIDRLQLANQHAVDALQQVRDSYAASALQMHEWIDISRVRGAGG